MGLWSPSFQQAGRQALLALLLQKQMYVQRLLWGTEFLSLAHPRDAAAPWQMPTAGHGVQQNKGADGTDSIAFPAPHPHNSA